VDRGGGLRVELGDAGFPIARASPWKRGDTYVAAGSDCTSQESTNGLGLPALSPDGKRSCSAAQTADGQESLWRAQPGFADGRSRWGDGMGEFPFGSRQPGTIARRRRET